MINNNSSINSLRSKSIFEEPICVDGVQVNKPRVYKEEDLWDLTGIFDKPDVTPTGKIMDLSNFFSGHV